MCLGTGSPASRRGSALGWGLGAPAGVEDGLHLHAVMQAWRVGLRADGVVEARRGADVDGLAGVEAEQPEQAAQRRVGAGDGGHLVLCVGLRRDLQAGGGALKLRQHGICFRTLHSRLWVKHTAQCPIH